MILQRHEEQSEPVRRELEAGVRRPGQRAPRLLHAMLKEIDPESAAAQIHANNVKRVIRAIEYFRQTGREDLASHNQAGEGKTRPISFSIMC
ncbi:MAG: hypothetical protein ACLTBV_21000 [Enterocloster bolteae]